MEVNVKKQYQAGVAYDVVGSDVPENILTWHDNLPFRIWVHARKSEIGHKPVSIDFQWIGKGKEIPMPSEEETVIRLQLAKLIFGASKQNLQASSFRGIPMGHVLDVHASLMADYKFGDKGISEKKVNLVKDFEHKGFTEAWLEMHLAGAKKSRPDNKELRASAEDSLVISMVYSQQSASGTKRPAKRTAELLGITPDLVYVALRIARKNGWLTSFGTGNSGGVLTELGLKRFKDINGEALLKKHLTE